MWAGAFIPVEDLEKFIKAPPADRTRMAREITDKILPVWLLFAAVCSALQEGECILTAEDAYWLGLIDEVIGSGLAHYRAFAEAMPSDG